MREIYITKDCDKMRLNKYLKKMFPQMPDSLIYRLIRKKYFEINNKKASGSDLLNAGDKLSIFLGEETFVKFYLKDDKRNVEIKRHNKYNIEKDRIVYEDNNILIYDKPVGILSQSDKSGDISLCDLMTDYIYGEKANTKKQDAISFKPSVVNRLDRNTRGLIIIAKNYIAAREITRMIKDRDIEKHYYTIVNGVIKGKSGILTNLYKKDDIKNKAIIKDITSDNIIPDGYSIVSLSYEILGNDLYTTTLDINLLTGKSHQIRAQLSHIGYPIICDKKYMEKDLYDDNKKRYGMTNQLLICYKIKFGIFENEVLSYLNNRVFKLKETILYGKKI